MSSAEYYPFKVSLKKDKLKLVFMEFQTYIFLHCVFVCPIIYEMTDR